MGRRKERRLAAINAAGRRVKLDLFAEPTGEMESELCQSEVAGDPVHEEHSGFPSSPSSSDQKPDNPLLLLGQYSDDEVDDSARKKVSKKVDLISMENPCIEPDTKVDESTDHNENTTGTKDKETTSSDVKLECDQLDLNGVERSDTTSGGDMPKICDSTVSGTEAVGDDHTEWKVVVHEESNQYYYWNTLTGETSWEVPHVLAQSAQAVSDQLPTSVLESTTESLAYANNESDGTAQLFAKGSEEYAHAITAAAGGNANMVYNSSQTMPSYGNNEIGMFYGVISGLPNYTTSQADQLPNSNEGVPHSNYEATDIDTDELVRRCESLLEKLKTLEGSDKKFNGSEWRLKYIVEIETRLSDCRALSPFGLSVLPFWWHTKAQLGQLESVVGKEVYDFVKSECCNEFDGGHASSLGGGSDVVESADVLPNDEENTCTLVTMIAEGCLAEENNISDKELIIDNAKQHHGSCQIPDDVQREKQGTIIEHPEYDSHFDEDIDMDVEMEVEEISTDHESTANILPTEFSNPPGESIKPKSLVESPPVPSDELDVPPPPDENWIPPLPPETEMVPPPPPEEPPSIPPPPPPTEISECSPHVEQYRSEHSLSFQYCTSAASDAQSIDYYSQIDSGHFIEVQSVQYHEPVVPGSYSNVGAVVSTEPVVYYDSHIQTFYTDPAITSLISPAVLVDSGSIPLPAIASTFNQTGSSIISAETGSVDLHSQKIESNSYYEANKNNAPVADVLVTSQCTENVHVNGIVANPPSTRSKPKVTRSKKRAVAVAPAFRSNKRVSSLVDKWKAAKEELHEDEDEEDEPQNAYEILERKKQKEIEEWRAQQIASGEAQDNANFIPLGGDWRERVKRKRAESKIESVQAPSDEVLSGNNLPDLVELSKGLPHGWQVYWDEYSTGAYYGNPNTGETTWTRPLS